MSEQDQKEVVRPYVVDGIEEYDNPLPPWWVNLFIFTIAFGFGYMIWIHFFGWNHLDKELQDDLLALEAKQKAAASVEGGASLDERLKAPELVKEGHEIFEANCASCHGKLGEGIVGPNLADNYWLHGGHPAEIVKTIADGVPAKGMIAWGTILGPKKIEAATAYIITLKGTNPPNAKAPQGEELKP